MRRIYTLKMAMLSFFFSAVVYAKSPNIILIMADDASPNLFNAYGEAGAAKTPNVDRLAKEGVMFKTAYATAMCGPSRVEIMTGRYANTTGVYHNAIWLGVSNEMVYTDNLAFSKVLHDAGYATAIAGKWHAGLQRPHEDVLAFDEYALWEHNIRKIKALPGSPKYTGLMEDQKTTSRYWHPAYVKNGKLMDTKPSDYGPRIEADFIIDFIERQAKAKKPFLAYWPTVAPHGTRVGMPTTPFYGEPGVLGNAPNSVEAKKRFTSLIEYLDSLIGEVIAKVEDLDIADNTIIMFVSDNGSAVKAKNRGVERGSRVVNIVWGAGIKNRGATSELTDFSDIAPTLIDWANAWSFVPQGYQFDGTSLKPFLTGEVDKHRDWIYAYVAGSQILRTKEYLLEAVNPILGMPKGRFYYTGDSRDGHNYKLVSNIQEHAKARAEFDQILKMLPPLQRDNKFFKTESGVRFLRAYDSPKSRARHLHNHKDFSFY